jgi:hypothetical protein
VGLDRCRCIENPKNLPVAAAVLLQSSLEELQTSMGDTALYAEVESASCFFADGGCNLALKETVASVAILHNRRKLKPYD